ncbi:MAG: EAL domain-containing protein, partial [Rhodospirillales bacterium]|nr:EAL domain-containing protein [Rhodospirillales bacterium]
MTSFHDGKGTVHPFPLAAERASAIEDAFEHIGLGLLLFDSDMNLVSMNARAIYILKLPGGALRTGAAWRDLAELGAQHGDRWPSQVDIHSRGPFTWSLGGSDFNGFSNPLPGGGIVVGILEPSVVRITRAVPEKDTPVPEGGPADSKSMSPELISLAEDLMAARDEARKAYQKAAESQIRVEAIVESVVDAIITTDGSGVIKTFNNAARIIFGYDPDEAIGKTLGGLFLPHGLNAHADLFSGDVAAKIQSVLGRSVDETGLTKSGIIFPVRCTVTEMMLGQQRMLNWVIRDVTEDLRTREALQQKTSLIQLLHTVAEAASEAESVAETIEVCLKSVCAHIDWPLGHAYGCGDNVAIGSIWHVDDEIRFGQFRSLAGPSPAGEDGGIIDRVALTGEATWFVDTQNAMSAPRGKAARACGVRSGFAVPVLADGEVVVVLEFFTPKSVDPEQSTLQALTQVGGQLGRAIERKRADETIRTMALQDSLTGLANREQFQRQMPPALANSLRVGRNVALMFLDVDHFKDVNDTLGHPIGDELLKEISKRLMICCRETDTVARLGGDEFAIIATNLHGPDGAATLARRIVDSLRAPVTLDGREIFITGSIGITVYPADGLDSADLQKNADLALYRAKDEGRDNYQFYDEEMNRSVQNRKTMERGLRAAITSGAFELHYQPQVDIKTRAVIGAEALIRWPHPTEGMISPMEFIPLAEATALIVPLGEWVLRTACIQFAKWRDAGLSLPRLAVNLSGVQLNKSPITDTVTRILAETGMAPENLELELTESTVMENVEAVIPVLQHLHDMGISIAVDDFGTGYSSLSYLKRLPVDKLKIDRSFVSDVTGNDDDAAIAQAITNLAKTLRLRVIAEGVETEEQLLFLEQIGCDSAQGYYLAKPLPHDVFAQWLKEN